MTLRDTLMIVTHPEEPVSWTPRDTPLGSPAARVAPPLGSYTPPITGPRARQRRYLPIIAAVAATALVAGAAVVYFAGRGAPKSANAPAPIGAAPSASAAASPLPAPPAARTLKLGQTVVVDPRANATVYAYRQPVATSAPAPDMAGYVWAAIDVKVCALRGPADGIQISQQPWALVYADGGIVQVSSLTYRQFPQPDYPFDRVVPWGRCARGWIDFAVPKARRPVMVEYQVDAGTSDWSID